MARLKNVNADGINSIVERISGVNPSKLASAVTGEKIEPGIMQEGGGAAAYLPGVTPTPADTQGLLDRIAMLEHRLAMVEGKGPSNRGPESSAFARDMTDKKKAEKDPADGKPDGKEQPDEEEPAEESAVDKNVIGLEMTEWRRLAGLGEAPLMEDKNIPVEDVDDDRDEYEAPAVEDADLDALWCDFLGEHDIHPGEFLALIDEAMESGNQEDIDSLLALEDMFHEAVNVGLRMNKKLTPELLGVKRRSRKAGLSRLDIKNEPEEKANRAVAMVKALKNEEEETEDDMIRFECDADEDGEPAIDWDRLERSRSEKTERGFGGMSRSGF